MRKCIIVAFFLFLFLNVSIDAQEKTTSQIFPNIPVILVDGVEVQSLDSIDIEDIIYFNVIKDTAVTKYFYPRVGGIICITTKSKRFLTPIIRRYKENVEANEKKKKKGEIYIR
jgi:hypothetical protein